MWKYNWKSFGVLIVEPISSMLMVGARDMVFPYVNMLSYWVYLLAVLVLVASFFMPGGPTGAGWTLYPPQAILSGTPGQQWGIVLMLASLILFIIGFTMGGLNYVVTVLQARTRGMTLMRMPLTVWGILTATVLALLAFPALFVGCVMLLFDKVLRTSFFVPAIVEMGEHLKYSGGSPLMFPHLFWFFGHPEVYIVAVPAFGIVSDLISTHARKNIFGYRMMVWAIVAIGALSFIVWAHHMYVSGMNPYFGFFFATTTLIIAIPTAIKVYNWVLTLWRGNIHLTVRGALLAEPQADSPAAKAGILSGDVITDVNGHAVKDAHDLARQIGSMTPGTTAKLTVWRKGEEKSFSLTLGEVPQGREARAARPDFDAAGASLPKLGLSLAPAGEIAGSGSEGVVVTEVDPDGLASEHGLKSGDVILEVGGTKVANAADVRKAVGVAQKNGKHAVVMRVKSDDKTKFVAIPIARA